MDKLDLTSKNIVNENIEKISELFPNCVVESEKGKSVDFDALRQELADVEIAGGQRNMN